MAGHARFRLMLAVTNCRPVVGDGGAAAGPVFSILSGYEAGSRIELPQSGENR